MNPSRGVVSGPNRLADKEEGVDLVGFLTPGVLITLLVVVVVFLPIVLAYTAWVFRVLKGRITLEHIRRVASLH